MQDDELCIIERPLFVRVSLYRSDGDWLVSATQREHVGVGLACQRARACVRAVQCIIEERLGETKERVGSFSGSGVVLAKPALRCSVAGSCGLLLLRLPIACLDLPFSSLQLPPSLSSPSSTLLPLVLFRVSPSLLPRPLVLCRPAYLRLHSPLRALHIATHCPLQQSNTAPIRTRSSLLQSNQTAPISYFTSSLTAFGLRHWTITAIVSIIFCLESTHVAIRRQLP